MPIKVRPRKWRRPFSWYFLWAFVFLIILLSLLVALLNLPIWQMRKIEIVGTQILSKHEIEALAAIPLGENLWLANFSRTRKNLGKVAAIKNLRISRIPPATIRLTLEERKPVAVFVSTQESAVIDEEGYILNRGQALTLNLPNLINLPAIFGIPQIDSSTAKVISQIIVKLTPFYEPKRLHLEYQNEENIGFLLEDLLRVRLGGMENLDKKMLVLEKLLGEIQGKWTEVDYLDVRFPENPVIKFKNTS